CHQHRLRRCRLEDAVYHADRLGHPHAGRNRRRTVALGRIAMAWSFERVAGPFNGRLGGLAWDGKSMLVSAVAEERVLRFDPESRDVCDLRRWTGRVNGIAITADGSVYGAQEGGRCVVRFMTNGSTGPVTEYLDGRRH